MRTDAGGKFWGALVAGAIAGLVGQYAEDIITNIEEGKTGKDIFSIKSTGKDYLASAIGGVVSATPGLGLAGTFVFGAMGNIITDSIKGDLKTDEDVFKTAMWGGGINVAGYMVENGTAVLKEKIISKMSRTAQKKYVNTELYKGSQGTVNTNFKTYKNLGEKGRRNIIMTSLRSYRWGVRSNIASTMVSTIKSAIQKLSRR